MSRAVRTIIGMACVAVGVLLAAWALYELIRIGSCSSGGPYVSARACPPGTGTKIVALMGGIFLVVGGAIITPGAAIAGVAWGLGFTMLGAAFFVAAFGPAAPPDAGSGLTITGIVVGGLFVLMGLPGLLAIFLGGRRGGGAGGGGTRAQRLLAHGKRCPGTVLSVQDTGMTINDNPRVAMRIRAEPAGEPAFEFDKTATVSRVQVPRQGDRCAVFYEPGGEGEPGVSFDAPALAMVGLAPGGAAPAAPRPAPAPAADADDDTIEELERLAKLRAAGALTDEEFQQAKARVLKAP